MRAILEAAGKRVHVYTSPNLVRVNERFRIGKPGGGTLVSDDELADVLAECERQNGDEPITVFEIETAAAFLLFSRHPADVVLLEVGLGGRLDATNVIEQPLATTITPISFDHTEFLGTTVGQIAAEKAGVLKRGVPAIVAPQPREALEAVERHALRIGAPMRLAGEDWVVRRSTAGSSIRMTTACSTCRRRGSSASISSTMPAPRLRPCGRLTPGSCRYPPTRPGLRRRMAGAAAAAVGRAPHSADAGRQRALA